jgi:hypothetical protein
LTPPVIKRPMTSISVLLYGIAFDCDNLADCLNVLNESKIQDEELSDRDYIDKHLPSILQELKHDRYKFKHCWIPGGNDDMVFVFTRSYTCSNKGVGGYNILPVLVDDPEEDAFIDSLFKKLNFVYEEWVKETEQKKYFMLNGVEEPNKDGSWKYIDQCAIIYVDSEDEEEV